MRSPAVDRDVALGIQSRQAAQLAGLQATGTISMDCSWPANAAAWSGLESGSRSGGVSNDYPGISKVVAKVAEDTPVEEFQAILRGDTVTANLRCFSDAEGLGKIASRIAYLSNIKGPYIEDLARILREDNGWSVL